MILHFQFRASILNSKSSAHYPSVTTKVKQNALCNILPQFNQKTYFLNRGTTKKM